MASPHFRAGVVAVVRRPGDDRVLAFERSDMPGAWQLPQGGVERGETFEEAAWRELHEETGLTADSVRLVGEHDDWTVYLWPSDLRTGERLGQTQRWFFFETVVDDLRPEPDGSEFSGWRWFDAAELIEQVVDFRRRPYQQVLGG